MKNNKNIIVRQGDCLLKMINAIPEGLKKAKDCVLLQGEATNHFHQILQHAHKYEDGETKYVEVLQDTELVHEEHAPIQLQKGCYKLVVQREVDLLGEIRQVMD